MSTFSQTAEPVVSEQAKMPITVPPFDQAEVWTKFRSVEDGELPVEARDYLSKYFVPLTGGQYAFLKNGNYVVMDKKEVNITYFDRLPPDVVKWFYRTPSICAKDLVYKLNEPALTKTTLNLCPQIKTVYRPYSSFSAETHAKVDIFVGYILEVLSSSNKDQYEYIMNWLTVTLKGGKNQSCIYMKGPEGIGKSALGDFIREHVIGKDLYLSTGSEPLISRFNAILGGKLLVVFEELEKTSGD